MTLVWEKIASEFVNAEHINGYRTLDPVLMYRAQVPGGWLLVHGLPSQTSVINFFPDPSHDWADTLPAVPAPVRRPLASLRH